MRPPEFSSDEVIAAGEELIKQGKSVTGFGLRGLLGGGNAQRLKTIWEEHVANGGAADEVAPDFPPELESHVKAAIDRMAAAYSASVKEAYAQAVKVTDKRVADLMAAANAQALAVERELNEANSLADGQQEALESLQAALERTEAQVRTVQQALDGAMRQIQEQAVAEATLKERIAHFQSEAARSAAHVVANLSRIGELEESIEQKKSALSDLKTQNQVLEQNLKQANKEKSELETSLKNAKDEAISLQNTVASQREEIGKKDGQLMAVQDSNNALMAKLGTSNDAYIATNETGKKTPARPRAKAKAPSSAAKT